jgi:CBS domain containing-hemolysin-like protein
VGPRQLGTVAIDIALGLLAVLVLILACGFFVAAEFAIVAVDRSRVEQQALEGRRGAKAALAVLKRLSFHLSGAQLGITITSLVIGFIAEPTIARALDPLVSDIVGVRNAKGVSVAAALSIATAVQMVLGELVPKSLAIAKPTRAAYALAGPMRFINQIFGPLITLLNGAANWSVRLMGIEPKEELASVRSLEELELLIRSSGQDGTLEPEAFTLLTRSIRFADKTAADALVPRLSVVWLSADDTVADLARRSAETGFSRFPVCGADLDDVLGVVHVKDVFSVPFEERPLRSVTAIMHEGFVVPESRELKDMLVELRRQGTHLAIVVDEYGGTAGIITMEDILEEIVGEIDDEHDPVAPPLTSVQRPGEWVVDGTTHPDEVFDLCGLELPEGEFETIAGFVLARLGHIPDVGERIEHDGWIIEVVERDRLRVAKLRLIAPPERATPA